ncbi:MAG: hypothetical protein EXR21_02010 [Flavobacteriaceae bacterium]|nr:hypothetical protein [Flavobacteriaceae bacterium]
MATNFFTNKDDNTLLKKFEGVFTHVESIRHFDALVGYFRTSASDTNDYVCKYQRIPSSLYSGMLVNEYIASKLLKHWGIESPETAIVKVKPLLR